MDDDLGVRRAVGPTILLHSGAYFDFLAPDDSDFTIEDIAHALAHICRYTGHASRFYSVAEHSVHCSFIVPPEVALAALLHDAAEAFVGDVSRPLKQLLPDYKVIEERVERAIFARLGLFWPFPPAVKQADMAMLALEQRVIMKNRDGWGGLERIAPAAVQIEFWSPELAKDLFLARYADLRDRLQEGRG